MQFIVARAVGFDVDKHRREGRRYGCGGQNYLVDQLQGTRLSAGGDKTDVSDARPHGIEIRCPDPQPPPLFILGGNGLHDLLVNVFGEHFLQ